MDRSSHHETTDIPLPVGIFEFQFADESRSVSFDVFAFLQQFVHIFAESFRVFRRFRCARLPPPLYLPIPTAGVLSEAFLSRTRARIPGSVSETAGGEPTTDSAWSQNASAI